MSIASLLISRVSHRQLLNGNEVKRESRVKKFVALISALTFLIPSAALANTKASVNATTLKCAKTKAIPHSTLQVPTPTEILRKIPSQITFVTNCGNIVITPIAKAPVALTAINALALAGYYDKSLCHRLTTSGIYVLQCGDPTASGTGGPMFTFGNENLPKDVKNNYPAGTVAMANGGPTNLNSNGSQFFFVYADSTLIPAVYPIWGRIKSGLEIVKAIGKLGTKDGSEDNLPKQVIAIEKIVIN